MTGNEYQRAALRTANINGDDLVLNGILGLCGETGEVADIVKKHLFQGHELDKEHVAEELGDVAWYLAVTAHAIGYRLEDIFRMNVSKLWRRYPHGFDSDRSVNRQTACAETTCYYNNDCVCTADNPDPASGTNCKSYMED